MPQHLIAFNTDELLLASAEVNRLARQLQNSKLEEDHWTSLYCRVRGAPVQGWSNLPFRDYLHNGLGVEFKLLKRDNPSGDIGRSLMHPAATRTISFNEDDDAEVAKTKVLNQWSAAITDFENRVKATSANHAADIRWGILLWAPTHTEYLYFEERLEHPNPSAYFARWHDGNHRGRPTRNLHIFEKASEKKRFSCTLPRNGAKLQPYFDIPDVINGAHIFRPEQVDSVPIYAHRADANALELLFPECSTEEAVARLISEWKARHNN